MKHQNLAVSIRGLCKSFGPVAANKDLSLDVRWGEILALLGENGSGKSTLVNMLSGLYLPDAGSIAVDGEPVYIRTPADSFRLGIGVIHQHFKLVDVMTALENIILGLPKKSRKSKKAHEKAVSELCDRYGLHVDLHKKVYNMSVGEKQTVEILKVLYRGARILILDEPTAVLTPQEIDRLFDILRKMRDGGKAIIIITHKLNEVMAVSDRVTVLRKGETAGTVETASTTASQLAAFMVGREINLDIERVEPKNLSERLNVVNLTCVTEDGRKALDNVTFTLNGGEILGVAGVAGSGQKELCEAIAGLYPVKGGAILYKNVVDGIEISENIVGKTPREIFQKGIAMACIPEDRLGMGLVARMDIAENMMLKSYNETKGMFVDRKKPTEMAKTLIERLDIATPGVNTQVSRLSGGNVQKVLLGREISSDPTILISAYPVRGLDIHSSYTIYRLLNEQKQKGVAVLFVGEDLDVLLALCDRIMVLCGGKCVGIVDAKTAKKEEIGLMMIGEGGGAYA